MVKGRKNPTFTKLWIIRFDTFTILEIYTKHCQFQVWLLVTCYSNLSFKSRYELKIINRLSSNFDLLYGTRKEESRSRPITWAAWCDNKKCFFI